jgi:hypothetical protein
MRISLLILFMCLSSLRANAQNEGDSVNIKMIVQNQIKAAQEVLEKDKIKLMQFKADQQAAIEMQKTAVLPVQKKSGAIEDIYLKIYLLLVAGFLAGLILAYRRKMKKVKSGKSKLLKHNIKLMRNEVPYPSAEDELSSIRKRMLNAVAMSQSANEISMGKANFRLSKGEILLAEKLISKLSNAGLNDENYSEEKFEVRKSNPNKDEKVYRDMNDKDVANRAKELKVSREEVMLAELLRKIKSNAA